jgi:topoisomerase-4 subunit A
MNAPVFPPPEGDRIIDEPLSEALSRRYLAYALSTIMHRALPDVRDGLKPVQRRLLYAMHRMRLNPEGAAKKCAKVVGEVMGQYHPHGDQSIYDALVRLTQEFAQRYPSSIPIAELAIINQIENQNERIPAGTLLKQVGGGRAGS